MHWLCVLDSFDTAGQVCSIFVILGEEPYMNVYGSSLNIFILFSCVSNEKNSFFKYTIIINR